MEMHFLLVKRGLYYRPNNQGYTGIKDHAGRYREVDALGLDGVAAIHEDDAPEYSSMCFADLAQKHLAEKLQASADRIEKLERALGEIAEGWETVAGYNRPDYAEQVDVLCRMARDALDANVK